MNKRLLLCALALALLVACATGVPPTIKAIPCAGLTAPPGGEGIRASGRWADWLAVVLTQGERECGWRPE